MFIHAFAFEAKQCLACGHYFQPLVRCVWVSMKKYIYTIIIKSYDILWSYLQHSADNGRVQRQYPFQDHLSAKTIGWRCRAGVFSLPTTLTTLYPFQQDGGKHMYSWCVRLRNIDHAHKYYLIMLNIDKILSLTLSKNLVFEADLVFNNTYEAPSGWSVASSPNWRGVAIVAVTDLFGKVWSRICVVMVIWYFK